MYTTKKLLLLLVLFANSFTLFAQCPDPSNDSTPPTAVCQDITVQLDANGQFQLLLPILMEVLSIIVGLLLLQLQQLVLTVEILALIPSLFL